MLTTPLIVAALLAAPPPATFTATVDGESETLVLEGIEIRTGEVFYVGNVTIGCTYVSASCVYFQSLFGPAVALLGNFYSANACEGSVSVETSFDLPICPVTYTVIGGLSSVTLTSRTDSAKLACVGDNEWLARTTSDGVGTYDIWLCPTELELVLPGTSYASNVWCSPIPSCPGPESVSSLGVDTAYVLSGGDEAKVVVQSVVDGTFIDPCPADLDGDGVVGRADLGLLLAAWGTPDGDVNGDGTTDGADLGILLNDDGPCPTC